MTTYSIEDVIESIDRYKLYILVCSNENLQERITWLRSKGVYSINIGKELASYISNLEDYNFLDIEVFDYFKLLLEDYKTKIKIDGNEVVAIFNFGILLEPSLELNPVKLLMEYSKTTSLILIWENQLDTQFRLHWPIQQQTIFFDFSENHLKQLAHEI